MADLEQIVTELATVVPQNPAYTYPLEFRLVSSDVVNAWTFLVERDEKLIPQLELMTGMVALAQGDRRILRATIAHEMAHLALGHSLEGSPYQDLGVLHTRQQEFEADAVGSQYLEALGSSREDMIDVLQLLDKDSKRRGDAWLHVVTGDHASPITRAARLAGEGDLLAAVARFEIGLAFLECRRYRQAISWFDEARASAGDWNLFEADVNAASAALQEYYDRLPAAVQEEWLRPDFGAHLTDVMLLRGRAIEVTDEDMQRYEAALARINAAPGDFARPMKKFLLATAQVLHPRKDEATLKQGVADLQRLAEGQLLSLWEPDRLRMRATNNLALGLQRLGESARAATLLMAEQAREPECFLPSVAENLARLPLEKLSKEQGLLAANVLFTFLTWTPVDAPGGREAERAFERLKKQYSLQVNAKLERAPVALCAAVVMDIDGHEIGLFEPFGKLSEVLGSIPEDGYVNPRLPNLRYLIWGDCEIIALVEGDQLIKLTSYRPGSQLELRSTRASGLRASYSVRVGMSESELDAVLQPSGGAAALQPQTVTLLNRRSFSAASEPEPDAQAATALPASEEEPWRYYPSLNFGVLIENGRVAGVSVTPVALH